MKKTIALTLYLAMTAFISGCATMVPNTGNFVDLRGTDFRQAKQARSCEFYILGFIGPFGGMRDIVLTARKGNIQDVRAVEYSNHYYVLFGQQCVTVTGL